MTLTLLIEGGSRPDNGAPAELVLHRRGAVVGRATTCDWPLPDPTRHLSSRHFEVRFDGTTYTLVDCSTNGTTLVATGQRLAGPHPIIDGDRFGVGPYVLVARVTGAAAAAPHSPSDQPPAWRGWDAGGSDGAASADPNGWDDPAAGRQATDGVAGWGAPPTAEGAAAASGWNSPAPRADTGERWQPRLGPSLAQPEPGRAAGWHNPSSPPSPSGSGWVPTGAMAPPPTPSTWEPAPAAPPPASDWSSAAPDRAAPASPDDLWGRIADGNVVDWARGGFGQPAEPVRDPLGLAPDPAAALPAERPPVPQAAPPPPEPAPPAAAPVPPRTASSPAAPPTLPPAGDPTATDLLRRLVAGLVVMMEARARAKAQLGAEQTAFSPGGHNPLKFARTPDEAIEMLLGPTPPGFMPAGDAVEDAFRDLQSHQVATLKAMQGALRATLDRFSPASIRARANAGGMIERIVPAARDAALWQAYSREFGGVVEGSDEAFLDIFAKEFRDAYNDQVRRAR